MKTLLFLGNLGTSKVIIKTVIVLLLFGGKKIYELIKWIGKAVEEFKNGTYGLEDEINGEVTNKENNTSS